MVDGPGELTCETKQNKHGYRKVCKVRCDDGQIRKGPQTTRCKNYNNRDGIAFKYWHTTKTHKKINCN